ncbi:MAG TPA: glucose-6-phosphate dehydrogenase assembly protein OpcA [Candidatus Didemnitutus sp.]|nr:glucose-6-phosphate dehydrogenase assembly protein OpcA [Candidatus Didemnitutus sp.]
MPEIFDALPGKEVPVGSIAAGFEKLWADTPAKDNRAVQLNLVLHYGRRTDVKDARVQFDRTLQFAHRYPCRVVVLCPDYDPKAAAEIRAKIYGECFLGKSKSDMRCVEVVLLHYTMPARLHLENQVTVCLSSDLPLYYWPHGFADVRRLADYSYLLSRSKRIMFDGAEAPPETFTYPWPNLSAVRDLAYTRTLPLRQNLGQFLSRYAPEKIIAGLERVALCHGAGVPAEASALLNWVRKGVARCGAKPETIDFRVTDEKCAGSFELTFTYHDRKKIFHWQANLTKNEARFTGDLGSGRSTLTVGAHLLAPEMALSEAMFF